MRFVETALSGVFVVEPEKLVDGRGFFARAWCRAEFESRGLNSDVAQINIARSRRRGTLRGLHYQRAPHEEAKLVRCTRGEIYDVVVDLRSGSGSYLRWVAVELTQDSHRLVYVPEGCAHGYLTLTDEAEITYGTSHAYVPGAASGRRYDDPALGISWPIDVQVISAQDESWPLLSEVAAA